MYTWTVFVWKFEHNSAAVIFHWVVGVHCCCLFRFTTCRKQINCPLECICSKMCSVGPINVHHANVELIFYINSNMNALQGKFKTIWYAFTFHRVIWVRNIFRRTKQSEETSHGANILQKSKKQLHICTLQKELKYFRCESFFTALFKKNGPRCIPSNQT